MTQLTAELLLDNLTAAEKARAARVESVLPELRLHAEEADAQGRFYAPHKDTLRQAGLLGLVVPEAYGGLGGGLRDLAAATFALGTACPSTALAYFFHCSSVSRGLLALEAVEKGMFSPGETPLVQAFGESVLYKMGRDGLLLGNFASESVKSSQSAVHIATTAAPVEGGWLLNGVKSFGCNTGVADEYLVMARVALDDVPEYQGAAGLALFFVPQQTPGVSERPAWDSLGMRASSSHGIILKDVFVPQEQALTVPGSFIKMMQMSRGSLLGNQLAIAAIYLGAARQAYDFALKYTLGVRFEDTGKPVASSPFHQEMIGNMALEMQSAALWLRRQLELETSDPPLLPKSEVVQHWRLAKGSMAESAFRIATLALKMSGTSNTHNHGVIARMFRDISMGLVMAFPAERGRLEAAHAIVEGREQETFSA